MPFSPTLARVVLSTPRRKIRRGDPTDTRLVLPDLTLGMLTQVQQHNRFRRQYRRIRHNVGVEIGEITRTFDKRSNHKPKPKKVSHIQHCQDIASTRAAEEAYAAKCMAEACDAIEKRIESGAPAKVPVFRVRKTSMGYIEELVPDIKPAPMDPENMGAPAVPQYEIPL